MVRAWREPDFVPDQEERRRWSDRHDVGPTAGSSTARSPYLARSRCQQGATMNREIVRLYDSFTHGGMSRRDFLDRLAALAGGTAAATALLSVLQNDYAKAETVAES